LFQQEKCPPAFEFNKTEAAEVGAYKCPGGGCTVAPEFFFFFITLKPRDE